MNETPNSPKPGLTKADVEKLLQQQLANWQPQSLQTLQVKIEELEKKVAEKDDKKTVEEQKKGLPLNGFLAFTNSFSTQASAVNRSLALGGIAIIWLFKWPKDGELDPELLNLPLFFLVLSLAIDLIQYFAGALAWLIFYETRYRKWKKRGFKPEEAKDIEAPNAISMPLWALFIMKILAMGVAYWYIIKYFADMFYAQKSVCG